MKQPPDSFKAPDFSGQTKILFFTEGSPTALLVTNVGRRHNVGGMKFATAFAAFSWCRRQGVAFVYFPLAPASVAAN